MDRSIFFYDQAIPMVRKIGAFAEGHLTGASLHSVARLVAHATRAAHELRRPEHRLEELDFWFALFRATRILEEQGLAEEMRRGEIEESGSHLETLSGMFLWCLPQWQELQMRADGFCGEPDEKLIDLLDAVQDAFTGVIEHAFKFGTVGKLQAEEDELAALDGDEG